MPWHNQRDSLVELGNWLGLVAGSLGKMAGDILLMCQNEVGELREGAHNGQRGGGSSTLPQKSNPVRSEAVLSLARPAAGPVCQLPPFPLPPHQPAGLPAQPAGAPLAQME